ncbi:MAG TPA: M48 family metallopeptidase [Xanthomonadaceae bacterium]|nr:M48 family metallopeptidase [Xanthomonadaceae bacterium]
MTGGAVLDAVWSDGRHSRIAQVRLWVADGRLCADGGGEQRDWALAEIVPSPRLGRAPRVLSLPDGGRIEVADGPVLAAWFPRPPSRIEAAADWLERRKAAIATAAACTLLLVLGGVRFGVPWLAEVVARHLPPVVERASSRQVVALLERMEVAPSRLPAARQARLRQEFRALVAGEPRAGQMHLVLVRAPGIGANAFTLPDGRIYLTDALVALAGSEDELLAVLAHEAGHHVHRHVTRQALESSSVFVLAGLLFGDASGSSLAVSLPAVLLNNGFSRGHEREADAYAIDLLRRRGVSPRAFASILRRLSREAGEPGGGPLGYLSTHPPTPERIAAAERAAR